MKKKILLIGARGVGKTSLLRRWQKASRFTKYKWIDLDQEIEKAAGQMVAELFHERGEAQFRQIESSLLTQFLLSPEECVIAVGAGLEWGQFDWQKISGGRASELRSQVEIIWVRRFSDSSGRIFLDRPRLEPNLNPLDEFAERHSGRFAEYDRQADWIYEMPEGHFEKSAEELALLENEGLRIGGCLTLQQRHREHTGKILNWKFDWVEIRDDTWTVEEAKRWRDKFGDQPILWSARKFAGQSPFFELARPGDEVDWALELGEPPDENITILSSHTTEAPLDPMGKRHLKWSPLVETWEELARGIEWQKESPLARSFLPRSAMGRWGWYRAWMKGKQKLNFVREFVSQAGDQPSLHEWLRTPEQATQFGAVLGSPVAHSWSPMQHLEFFRKSDRAFFAIDIRREEFGTALAQLMDLGLIAAAVTAPLKALAFTFAAHPSQACEAVRSANTLWLTTDGWHAENTDLIGIRKIAVQNDFLEPIFVWGGGGTLATIKSVFPEAIEYSVRTRKERETQIQPFSFARDSGQSGAPENSEAIGATDSANQDIEIDWKPKNRPQTVIWAASPSDALPPAHWLPKAIFDLNYVEHSRAREYAMKLGARYISGQSMFVEQAKAQQEIWKKL